MKCFVALLTYLLVVTYAELPPRILQIIKEKVHKVGYECKKEVGASNDDLAPIWRNEPASTYEGKCILSCMSKKIGFLDRSGKLDKDNTMSIIEKLEPIDEEFYTKMKKIIKICLDEITEEDECEIAGHLHACLQREKTVVGLQVIDLQR